MRIGSHALPPTQASHEDWGVTRALKYLMPKKIVWVHMC